MKRVFLTFLVLVGLLFSIILTRHFYSVRNGTSKFSSFCNIGSMVNCDTIAASQYAEVFGGSPLSSVAIGWFLGLFILSLCFLKKTPFLQEASLRAFWFCSLVGTLVGIYYFFVMVIKLKTFCLFCLGIDAVHVLCLTLSTNLKKNKRTEYQKKRLLMSLIAFVALCSLLGPIVTASVFNPVSLSKQEMKELVQSILETPVVPLQVGPQFPGIGPVGAPITIVEFSDFQCPFCRIGAVALHVAMQRFPGKVRLEFRHFPLDRSCNPVASQTLHPAACEAARIAICAHELGHFEKTYEDLFESQATFEQSKTRFESEPMKQCLASVGHQEKVTRILLRDVEEARHLEIAGTPLFFINGHRVAGMVPVMVWVHLIESLLP